MTPTRDVLFDAVEMNDMSQPPLSQQIELEMNIYFLSKTMQT